MFYEGNKAFQIEFRGLAWLGLLHENRDRVRKSVELFVLLWLFVYTVLNFFVGLKNLRIGFHEVERDII